MAGRAGEVAYHPRRLTGIGRERHGRPQDSILQTTGCRWISLGSECREIILATVDTVPKIKVGFPCHLIGWRSKLTPDFGGDRSAFDPGLDRNMNELRCCIKRHARCIISHLSFYLEAYLSLTHTRHGTTTTHVSRHDNLEGCTKSAKALLRTAVDRTTSGCPSE